MKIIRAGDCRTTPWKNGGGSTTEIVADPPGSSLDNFDWRISMARIAADGPFSEFAGIDRTLAVVMGTGLILTIGSNATMKLDRDCDPVCFAGDVPTSARLTAGEITDLNVMTRRSRFSHRLRRIGRSASCEIGEEIAVVLSLNGSTTLASDRGHTTLNHGDAAILSGKVSLRIEPMGASDCYLVLLCEHQPR